MKQLKILSIAVMILGIVHTVATPIIFSPLYGNIHDDLFLSYLYMFLITGFATFFIGWLQNFIVKKGMENSNFQVIMKVCIFFIIMLGGSAVSIMWENPFAYIALIVGLYQLVIFRRIRNNLKLVR